MWVTHFFSHAGSTEEEREAFRNALAQAGFGTADEDFEPGIGSDEEITGDGFWHHYSFTEVKDEEVDRLDRRAAELSLIHGVKYNGWGPTNTVPR